jgi:hypothetical protein
MVLTGMEMVRAVPDRVLVVLDNTICIQDTPFLST